MRIMSVLPLVALLIVTQARADDTAIAAGMKAFNASCVYCHSTDNARINGQGPYLFGVYGRQSGTAVGYTYTSALTQAGEKGLIWNDRTLNDFLKKPHKVVAGTEMRDVITDGKSRKQMIAYLKSLK